jgi:hypothetical protein
VTRLTDDGHQTPILTSRDDLRALEVAYRMFERWRQENFFKYMRDEYAIDALAEHTVEPADPMRTVPNPARRSIEKELAARRATLVKLEQTYGAAAIDNEEARRPTIRGFKIAHGQVGQAIRAARAQIALLERRRAALPARVPVAEALDGDPVVKLTRERKHLTNIVKMVAYQIESDLVERVRPHYARVEDEGRTLIQSALQSAAALAPAKDELRVTLAPLSSPHRSRAIAAVCDELNQLAVTFPGTSQVLRYAVADDHP